uniref:[histone H4]-lysine(20) N-methyltransferase n=1 Tax=Neogobius melanostomus TaxID=47308 RepID=A0A8C6TFC3_9GOBI
MFKRPPTITNHSLTHTPFSLPTWYSLMVSHPGPTCLCLQDLTGSGIAKWPGLLCWLIFSCMHFQEVVCNSHTITVLENTKTMSLVHDEKKNKMTQEKTQFSPLSQENEPQECKYLLFFGDKYLDNVQFNIITIHFYFSQSKMYIQLIVSFCSVVRKNSQNRKVTDYYPIRRSSRKSKTELKCEQKKVIDDLITNGIEEGMEVQQIEGKGRAVFATRSFQKGEYVVEYHGDLLQITDAKKREAEYAQNPATGCYMYYFQYLCKTFCVDATRETGRMGRLINHSKNGNCQTKLHDINGVPHLILVASRNIEEGEELLYDYGDRSKASIAAHPWLKD